MTDHHRPTGPKPTARQQRCLRQLAMERGVSFVPPRTCFEASRLIDQLKRRRPDTVADRRREIRSVQDDTLVMPYGQLFGLAKAGRSLQAIADAFGVSAQMARCRINRTGLSRMHRKRAAG